MKSAKSILNLVQKIKKNSTAREIKKNISWEDDLDIKAKQFVCNLRDSLEKTIMRAIKEDSDTNIVFVFGGFSMYEIYDFIELPIIKKYQKELEKLGYMTEIDKELHDDSSYLGGHTWKSAGLYVMWGQGKKWFGSNKPVCKSDEEEYEPKDDE